MELGKQAVARCARPASGGSENRGGGVVYGAEEAMRAGQCLIKEPWMSPRSVVRDEQVVRDGVKEPEGVQDEAEL